VRFYAAYLHPSRPPVLVHQGFSWWAAIFGPIWFFVHGAWIAGLFGVAVNVLVAALTPPAFRLLGVVGLAWLYGLFGQELREWNLRLRGYYLAHILAARDDEAAYGRLLAARPELAASALR